MKIFETLKHWTAASRFALPASLVVAIWGLLAFAAPASAEIDEAVEGTAAPAAVAETPMPVVEDEEVQTAPVAPAPEPVETAVQEAPSATQPPDAAPVGDPVGPQNSPSGSESLNSPSPSPQVAAAQGEASKLVQDLGKGPVESIAAAADRLPGVRNGLGPSLQRANNDLQRVTEPLFQVTAFAQKSLGSLGSAAVGDLLPSVEPLLEIAARPSAGGPLGFSAPPRVGSLFHPPAIGGSPFQRLPEPGGIGVVATGSRTSDRAAGRVETRPSAAGDASVILAGATIDRARSEPPAPLDVPLPAPESPGAIAPGGSGGPIFVPLVALLAFLLALVAPAILRRLGRVPDFRPSTPFVCALERPG